MTRADLEAILADESVHLAVRACAARALQGSRRCACEDLRDELAALRREVLALAKGGDDPRSPLERVRSAIREVLGDSEGARHTWKAFYDSLFEEDALTPHRMEEPAE